MLGDPVQFNHVEFEIVNQSLEQAIVVIKYILIVDVICGWTTLTSQHPLKNDHKR